MMKQYLTPSEVVKRYNSTVTEKTLANWRSRGEGPDYLKVGGKILYPVIALATWEASRLIKLAAAKKITSLVLFMHMLF